MAIIENLIKFDEDKNFDAIFEKYYSFIKDEDIVRMVNVVDRCGKIAFAKPHLFEKKTNELLKSEEISTTLHPTEEY